MKLNKKSKTLSRRKRLKDTKREIYQKRKKKIQKAIEK